MSDRDIDGRGFSVKKFEPRVVTDKAAEVLKANGHNHSWQDEPDPNDPRFQSSPSPPATKTKDIRFVPKSEFIKDFVPPEYIIDGMLQRGFIYSLTAQTGHGKTAITMLLSQLLGSSDPNPSYFGKHQVEKGNVVYFAGENPEDIRMRVLGNDALFNDEGSRVLFVPGTFNISEMRSRLEAERVAIT